MFTRNILLATRFNVLHLYQQSKITLKAILETRRGIVQWDNEREWNRDREKERIRLSGRF